ncbi:MAG: hypothetical protein PHU82_02180 [Candidatus Pacebacteria bacterium]|jgi:hypothetical protein|nr:hypothetical protein [Candidatus Paceibacterota bacterium]MDD4994751.1 hypothetical protein [Candidatus Paceibacterota bacterium]
MKKFQLVILVLISLVLLMACYFLNVNGPEWKIETLDVSNILRENPLVAQAELESPQLLREFEMRIAVFQIRSPKGSLILDHISRAWHQKGLIQGYSIGLEDVYFRFEDKKIEAWINADKFFTAQGEIIIRLLSDDGQIVAEARRKVDIDHRPLLIND